MTEHVWIALAHRQSESGEDICHEIEEEDLQREERKRKPEEYRKPDDQDFGKVAGEEVGREPPDIPKDDAALAHGVNDRRERIIEKDHVGCFARNLGSAQSHGDPDIGFLQRRRVIDAVAYHGDDVSLALK